MSNFSRADTERSLWLDQEAQRVKCATCGHPLKHDHGIIHMNEQTGVTWWECKNCGRRIKEEYRIENQMIVSTMVEEV